MPPAAARARRGGREQLPAGEVVHERRFSDTRRAEQGDRPAHAEVGLERFEPSSRDGADRVDRYAHDDRLDLQELRLGVVREVELVDDDHRARAAVPGRREVTLEPARVEVEAEGGDDENGVDVCRDHLGDGSLAGSPFS